MAGVAALVDRAVDLPPGAGLAAVLEQLSGEPVPNARRVEVLQARSRQLAHEQAQLFAELVELSHTVALADVKGERGEVVARAATRFEWAAHEIAAALTWTPTAADRELGFATALVQRLPLVQEALLAGRIDRGKAWVFADYLDPDHGEVTEVQARRLCERFVPLAPRLTTKQLSDRLLRALHAIDPNLRRRQYQRAVQARSVALYLDPRTGTATLVGNGLPPGEAAAAAARLDRLVETAKRAGHPGTRPQISADLFLGMLNGTFHGLTEHEIIDRLLALRRPEDHRDPEAPVSETDAPDTAPETTVPAATVPETAPPAGSGRGAVREGIEVRAGLATLAGLDDRPGEIPGLGPVGADVARTAAAAQHRGAAWRFAIVDANGYLLLAGPLRRRPRTAIRPSAVRGGVVELHVTVEELHRHGTNPDLGAWAGVLAEIADAWTDRDRFRQRLAAHPRARFARGALADHIRIRDRNCVGPGCTRSARRSDLDHTREHGRGGRTVEVNIGPACKRHHPDKDRGWTLTQPEPGVFVWISPLGRTHRTRGEPIRPDLPDPEPTHDVEEESAAELDLRLRRHEPRILQRPATEPPRPPPPEPAPLPDDEPPPF
ncbi:HNH endonuclease signature motif containing protein [Pseudonocardia sp. DLS-67]